jgi:hypothetical protein
MLPKFRSFVRPIIRSSIRSFIVPIHRSSFVHRSFIVTIHCSSFVCMTIHHHYSPLLFIVTIHQHYSSSLLFIDDIYGNFFCCHYSLLLFIVTIHRSSDHPKFNYSSVMLSSPPKTSQTHILVIRTLVTVIFLPVGTSHLITHPRFLQVEHA